MASHERKYKGALTLGKLELALEAHEQLFGTIAKLEAVGASTVATYDDSDFPTLSSLALVPMIGGTTGPKPTGSTHLFDGEAVVLGTAIGVSVFRTD